MSARIRTGYSFRTAYGSLSKVAERLVECGFNAAPITDRGSAFGFVKWRKVCAKHGLRPIYGIELGVSPSIEAKKPAVDHFTFLAIDSIVPLNELIGLASSQFRYEPLLNYEQLNYTKGLIKIAGRRADLSKMLPDGLTYVAASPSANVIYLREALAAGFPIIACSDNYYVSAQDEGAYQVLVGRGANTQTYPTYILSDDEWREAMLENDLTEQECDKALAVRSAVLEGCTAAMPMGRLLSPDKPETLLHACETAAPRLGIDLADPIYRARLDRELKLIEEKKFEDYFYIVGDLVRWARKQMTVGPARGSSCGSLVCYLLEITTINPIKYDLLFERFIDLNRDDLPDIDIDFSHVKRDLALKYLMDKYGKSRVAQLGTVAMFKAAAAMNGAAAALKIPQFEVKGVMDSVIKRFSGDARAMDTLHDTMTESPAGKLFLAKYPEMMVATKMEGHPSHFSKHASGVLVTDIPLTNYIGIDTRTGATHCDKKDAEELDLLKIDMLGLIQLSVFEDALALAGLPQDFLDTVPLDDQSTFDLLNRRQFAGVFQFNGLTLKNVAQQIHFTELEDIVAVTALARPGPLASGGTITWLKRKSGAEPITYPHPLFEPMLRASYGCVIYQEQVMEIGRKIGDLSWEDVTALRKAMSKSMGKEYFDTFGDRWKAGAAAKGIPKEILNKVWDDLCAYGSWSFNRSHSVAYGIVSYWCAWMKSRYPLEFAAATLQHEDDAGRQIAFLRELDAEGIRFIPVDAELSTDKWRVDYVNGVKMLIGPVTNVKGFGPKTAKTFMSAKARGEPLPDNIKKKLASPVTSLDTLWPVRDAFSRLLPDPRARNIFTTPTQIGQLHEDEDSYSTVLFCVISKINPRDENEDVKIARRGGKRITDGPTDSLHLTLVDDTGQIFAKINRFDFSTIGNEIIDRGKPGKCLYVVKGETWGDKDFRGISVKGIRYIGDLN